MAGSTDARASLESFGRRVKELKKGESEAKGCRLDADVVDKGYRQQSLEALRNNVAAAVKRAQDATGNRYTTETAESVTKSFDFIQVVLVTRVE
jgi:hypothetical protein